MTDGEFAFVALGLGLVALASWGTVLALTAELHHRGKAIMEPIDPCEYETRRQALEFALQHTMHIEHVTQAEVSPEDVVTQAKVFDAFLSDAAARVR